MRYTDEMRRWRGQGEPTGAFVCIMRMSNPRPFPWCQEKGSLYVRGCSHGHREKPSGPAYYL